MQTKQNVNAFSSGFISLPFLGKLSPKKCLDKAHRETITNINVPEYLLPEHQLQNSLNTTCNYFVLRLEGNAMQLSGLLHNDLLVIEPSSTAKNGAIVIATIDNVETVILHFEQTNDLIILSSKNPDTKPMIFDPSRIKINGILVSQMRTHCK